VNQHKVAYRIELELWNYTLAASGLLRNWRDWIKALDLRDWPGANRSDSRSYREDEQQRHARKNKLSCRVNYEADH
jgi:hypothetical protein